MNVTRATAAAKSHAAAPTSQAPLSLLLGGESATETTPAFPLTLHVALAVGGEQAEHEEVSTHGKGDSGHAKGHAETTDLTATALTAALGVAPVPATATAKAAGKGHGKAEAPTEEHAATTTTPASAAAATAGAATGRAATILKAAVTGHAPSAAKAAAADATPPATSTASTAETAATPAADPASEPRPAPKAADEGKTPAPATNASAVASAAGHDGPVTPRATTASAHEGHHRSANAHAELPPTAVPAGTAAEEHHGLDLGDRKSGAGGTLATAAVHLDGAVTAPAASSSGPAHAIIAAQSNATASSGIAPTNAGNDTTTAAAPSSPPPSTAAGPDPAASRAQGVTVSHPGAVEARWSERVADAVRLSAVRGGGEIRMQLEPEGLGHIDVRVHLQSDGVHAVIVTEHESTRALLTGQQHVLQDAFARNDIRLSGFSVDVGSGGGTAAFGDRQARDASGPAAAPASAVAADDGGTASADPFTAGRVNVRV